MTAAVNKKFKPSPKTERSNTRPASSRTGRQYTRAAVAEALAVHDGDFGGFRGYISINHRENAKAALQQHMLPVRKLASKLPQLMRQHPAHDFYLSACAYVTDEERVSENRLALTCAWLDLDTYKRGWDVGNAAALEATIAQLMDVLDAHGVARPSYIVRARGLQLKWLFTQPVTPKAWGVLSAALKRLASYLDRFGADLNALHPTQLLRVVGSLHSATGRRVEIVWTNSDRGRVPFDEFLRPPGAPTALLPYSVQQIAEIREREAVRTAYSKNSKLRADLHSQLRVKRAADHTKRVSERHRAGTSLAQFGEKQLALMAAVVTQRFGAAGVPHGQRNNWTWLAAAAASLVHPRDPAGILRLTQSWCASSVPSYSYAEIAASAAAVLRKAGTHRSGAWMMRASTYWSRLSVSAEELVLAKVAVSGSTTALAGERWQTGAMQFSQMRGLEFHDYVTETRRRQRLAAERTNEIKRAAAGPLVLRAHELAAAGHSQTEIAARLRVSQSTVSRYLRDPVLLGAASAAQDGASREAHGAYAHALSAVVMSVGHTGEDGGGCLSSPIACPLNSVGHGLQHVAVTAEQQQPGSSQASGYASDPASGQPSSGDGGDSPTATLTAPAQSSASARAGRYLSTLTGTAAQTHSARLG